MLGGVCPGGVCSGWGGVCLEVSVQGGLSRGVSAQGCLLMSVCPGGVCLEGLCLVGVSAKECVHVHGGVHPLYQEADTP